MSPDLEYQKGKVLAFDWGLKHVGVALIVLEQHLVLPLRTLRVGKEPLDSKDLTTLISDHKPLALVVGLPRNMDNSASAETALARRFGSSISEAYGLPVLFMDERLSSREAIYRSNNPRPDHSLAAVVIGETWLNQLDPKASLEPK